MTRAVLQTKAAWGARSPRAACCGPPSRTSTSETHPLSFPFWVTDRSFMHYERRVQNSVYSIAVNVSVPHLQTALGVTEQQERLEPALTLARLPATVGLPVRVRGRRSLCGRLGWLACGSWGWGGSAWGLFYALHSSGPCPELWAPGQGQTGLTSWSHLSGGRRVRERQPQPLVMGTPQVALCREGSGGGGWMRSAEKWGGAETGQWGAERGQGG